MSTSHPTQADQTTKGWQPSETKINEQPRPLRKAQVRRTPTTTNHNQSMQLAKSIESTIIDSS